LISFVSAYRWPVLQAVNRFQKQSTFQLTKGYRMKTTKWVVLFTIICASAGSAVKSSAQTAVYGEFSASQYTNSPAGDYLYGGTAGVVIQAASFGRHVRLLGDVQGRFVQKSGEEVNGLTVGPRFAFPIARLAGFTPYAEFLTGFARYDDPTHNGPTDSTFQTNAGVTKRLSKHWDAVGEYSWAHYGAFQDTYSPQTFSAGAMFHFSR
jgi:opacity protein-like surface antigen